MGTATYMAPEQATGDTPVAASDWYSVGALLYEAIVGSPPFGGSAVDVLTLKSSIAAMAPSDCVDGVPEDLDALCSALLAPDPEDRPDAAEILRRLGAKATSDHGPCAPRPRTASSRPSWWAARRSSALSATRSRRRARAAR